MSEKKDYDYLEVPLDKEDLISLVKGSSPSFKLMDELYSLGKYDDNRGYQWDKYALEKLTLPELLIIYTKCKNSRKPKLQPPV